MESQHTHQLNSKQQCFWQSLTPYHLHSKYTSLLTLLPKSHFRMKNYLKSIFFMLSISLLLLNNLPSIEAFAAGKKNRGKGKKGSKNVVGRGFGSSTQPSLEEVVAKFPNRMPPNALECECPCGTYAGKLYKDCCAPFHNKEKLPSSPLDVLRTRYTAFVVRFVNC